MSFVTSENRVVGNLVALRRVGGINVVMGDLARGSWRGGISSGFKIGNEVLGDVAVDQLALNRWDRVVDRFLYQSVGELERHVEWFAFTDHVRGHRFFDEHPEFGGILILADCRQLFQIELSSEYRRYSQDFRAIRRVMVSVTVSGSWKVPVVVDDRPFSGFTSRVSSTAKNALPSDSRNISSIRSRFLVPKARTRSRVSVWLNLATSCRMKPG